MPLSFIFAPFALRVWAWPGADYVRFCVKLLNVQYSPQTAHGGVPFTRSEYYRIRPGKYPRPSKRPGTDFCHTNGKHPLPGKRPGRIPVALYGKCPGNPASHACRKASGSLTGCRTQLHKGVADDYLDRTIQLPSYKVS